MRMCQSIPKDVLTDQLQSLPPEADLKVAWFLAAVWGDSGYPGLDPGEVVVEMPIKLV